MKHFIILISLFLISSGVYASPPVDDKIHYWTGKYYFRTAGLNSPSCRGFQGGSATFKQMSASLGDDGYVTYNGILTASGFYHHGITPDFNGGVYISIRISPVGNMSISGLKTSSHYYIDSPPTLNIQSLTYNNYCILSFKDLIYGSF